MCPEPQRWYRLHGLLRHDPGEHPRNRIAINDMSWESVSRRDVAPSEIRGWGKEVVSQALLSPPPFTVLLILVLPLFLFLVSLLHYRFIFSYIPNPSFNPLSSPFCLYLLLHPPSSVTSVDFVKIKSSGLNSLISPG